MRRTALAGKSLVEMPEKCRAIALASAGVPANMISTMDDGAAWHPKTQALHAYWRSPAPAIGLLPARSMIDAADTPNLLSNIFMLDVIENPLRFRYRLAGTKLLYAGDRELTGMLMEEAHPNLFVAPPYADYPACVREHRVSRRLGSPVFDWNREHVLIERLLLPLASDGRKVDVILGLSVFFDADRREL